MSSVALKLKPPKNYPTKLALDIIKSIIAKKGPIETKQLWALSQKVRPTRAELEQDRLERERVSEIDQLVTPGWVPPEKPPEKDQMPSGLSRKERKKHRKLQAQLAKAKKLDNGHPVKSVSYMKHFILPALVNLREIEKFHIKRKLNQEEIDAKLRSMTPEARLRKGPALGAADFPVFPWRLREPKMPRTPKANLESKVLEEVLGKNVDWGHLNKRRQETRLEKIEKDIQWAKKVQDSRMQGAVQKALASEKAQAVRNMEVKAEQALALEAAKLKQLPAPSSNADSS
ncbi:hypothetical protein PILCRDRAFT_824478 [Piloderma croceum F 1598]|uniref:Uncharacterized protein n=1 Tax=Piloderma croceum (strain F 1598) TaxID=765440 RepID=A0A0C3AQP6_PILCF|nr:hypothetical protein PILCRDRAFT_826619 [Piloderma croceum F 1598]KIM78258.1 hypothetical protein PILCRDRAFT_824478 [Piloderma croceum F 1598]